MSRMSDHEPEETVDQAARIVRRLTALVVVLMALVVVNLAGSTYIGVRAEETHDTVFASPCAKNTSSPECQQLRRELDRTQPLQDACIQIVKVGYPCPAPRD